VKVRIGYGLGIQGLADPGRRFTQLVDALESNGVDSLWLSERVGGPAPDPLIGLAVAARRTTHLKLGTSVLVVPGRNPALLAKELASLDLLSNGRLLPAVGLGAPRPLEQQAFGVERGERAARFDEALPLIRQFWTGLPVTHHGPHFHYEGLTVLPRPAQNPPDIWLGGMAPSELRRVGRLGDGWLPSFCTPDDAAAGREIVEKAAAEADRAIDPEHFGVLVIYLKDGQEIPARVAQTLAERRPGVDPADVIPTGWDNARAHLERFVARGFSKFVLLPVEEPADWDDEISRLAKELLPLQS
jgi:probable F420-dependent oxidoreductase